MKDPTTYGPYGSEQETRHSPLGQIISATEVHFQAHVQPHFDALINTCVEARVELGQYDVRTLRWLAGFETASCQSVIGIISRAYAAGLAQGRAGGEQA